MRSIGLLAVAALLRTSPPSASAAPPPCADDDDYTSPVRMSCADHCGFDCRGLAEAFLFTPRQTRALLSRCPVSCRRCPVAAAEVSVAGGIDDPSAVPAQWDGGSPSPAVPPTPLRYRVSTRALRGYRAYMEDEYAVALHGRFAGVYDGHGVSVIFLFL